MGAMLPECRDDPLTPAQLIVNQLRPECFL